MGKMVHIWEVKCKSCGTVFQHVFVASDLFKTHILNEVHMKCPSCGKTAYDPVRSLEKMSFEQWSAQHPELPIISLPDHSYLESK